MNRNLRYLFKLIKILYLLIPFILSLWALLIGDITQALLWIIYAEILLIIYKMAKTLLKKQENEVKYITGFWINEETHKRLRELDSVD